MDSMEDTKLEALVKAIDEALTAEDKVEAEYALLDYILALANKRED